MQNELELNIVMKPVNEIIPYWRNPRRNDKTVDELVKTIPVAGFNVPIVIDKNGVVVKGHARLKAAKRLGMEQVPCIVSEAPEDVIKADRIADNKIQELSGWDFSKLNLELERHEGSMKFMSLFRPEETPLREDFQMPDVGFKPVGLEFGGDYGDEDVPEYPRAIPMPTTGGYVPEAGTGMATPQMPAEGAQRTLRTLCPYCGKVVVLNV